MESTSAMNTVMYHFQFVKNGCSLPNAIHLFPDFRPSYLKLSPAGTGRSLQYVLKKAYSRILPAQGEGTEYRAAPGFSSSQHDPLSLLPLVLLNSAPGNLLHGDLPPSVERMSVIG